MTENALKGLKKWESMSHKERNDLLESIGGCGNCGHWNHTINPMMNMDYGCRLKGRKCTESRQLYDGGCIAHTRLMNAL